MERLNCYTHNSNRGALNLKGLRGTRYRVHRFFRPSYPRRYGRCHVGQFTGNHPHENKNRLI